MSTQTVPVIKSTKSPAELPRIDWGKVSRAKVETVLVDLKAPVQRKNEDGSDYMVRLTKREDAIAKRASRVVETLTKVGAPAEQISEAESRALCYRAVPVMTLGKVAVPVNGRLGRALSLLAAKVPE
jgi:hypothetical protein